MKILVYRVWRLAALAILPPLVAGGCGFFGPRARAGVRLAGEPVGNYTLFHLRRRVRDLALFLDRPARRASLDPGTWEPIAAQSGVCLEVEPTVERVLSAPVGARVEPVLRRLDPAGPRWVRPLEIARYQTPILDAQAPRVHNLAEAARVLDGYSVLAGRVFSLNAVVDTAEMRRRYRPAPVIGDGGEIRLEPGGGLCQLATTLYNAVMAAGLAVTEVHRHSKPVSYVPAGRDATIYTDKDFRFANDLGEEIKIRASVAGRTVLVRLLSKPGRKLESKAESSH